VEKVPIPASPVHPRPPLAVKSISEPASHSGQASVSGENQNQKPKTKNQTINLNHLICRRDTKDYLLKLGLVLQVSCLLQIVLRVLSYPITLNRVVRLLVDNFGGRCSIDPGPRLARTAVKLIYIYIYRLRWISRLTSDQIPSSPN